MKKKIWKLHKYGFKKAVFKKTIKHFGEIFDVNFVV